MTKTKTLNDLMDEWRDQVNVVGVPIAVRAAVENRARDLQKWLDSLWTEITDDPATWDEINAGKGRVMALLNIAAMAGGGPKIMSRESLVKELKGWSKFRKKAEQEKYMHRTTPPYSAYRPFPIKGLDTP